MSLNRPIAIILAVLLPNAVASEIFDESTTCTAINASACRGRRGVAALQKGRSLANTNGALGALGQESVEEEEKEEFKGNATHYPVKFCIYGGKSLSHPVGTFNRYKVESMNPRFEDPCGYKYFTPLQEYSYHQQDPCSASGLYCVLPIPLEWLWDSLDNTAARGGRKNNLKLSLRFYMWPQNIQGSYTHLELSGFPYEKGCGVKHLCGAPSSCFNNHYCDPHKCEFGETTSMAGVAATAFFWKIVLDDCDKFFPPPTPEPTPQPTPEPTPQPTPEPTPQPTPGPTPQPTPGPTPSPTMPPPIPCYSDSVLMNLYGSKVVSNNLGGMGPKKKDDPLIHLQNVGTLEDGTQFDMKLTNLSSYTPKKSENNKLKKATFQINVAHDTSTNIEVGFFKTIGGEAVELPSFEFTFLDFDNSIDSQGREILHVNGCDDYILVEGHELDTLGTGNGSAEFGSARIGSPCDNPPDPWALGLEDCGGTLDPPVDTAKRSAMFGFKTKSKFDITMTVEGGDGARNFLFAGRSNLVDACRDGHNGPSGAC